MPSDLLLKPLPSRLSPAEHLQKNVGAALLVSAALFLVFGIPGLYSLGRIDITTVNTLGRFLALAIVALGADLVWGYTGVLSLFQAMFFCFGGYAIGMHMALRGPLDGDGIPRCLFVVSSEVGGMSLPWFWMPFKSLLLSLVLGVLLPGLFGFLFGFFMFRSRVRGVYFSIITQTTTWAMLYVFRMNNMKLCGTNGLTNFVTLAGFNLQSDNVRLGLYIATTVVLVVAFLVCQFLARSRLGRLLVAIRDGESRLRFAGYQPVTFKVFIFVFAAMLAAVGGMLYTPQNGIITPAKMEIEESVIIIAFVAVGGRGTLSGAVLGTLIVSYIKSLQTSGSFYACLPAALRVSDGASQAGVSGALRRFLHYLFGPDGWYFTLGIIFICVTLFFPTGIVGAWRNLFTRNIFRRKPVLAEDKASAAQEDGSEPSLPRAAGTEAAP
jgi:urea transport system permease protein